MQPSAVEHLATCLRDLMIRYVCLDRISATWESSARLPLDTKRAERQVESALASFRSDAEVMVGHFSAAQDADVRVAELRYPYVFAISPAVALERACSVGLRSPAGQNLLGCLRTRLRAEAAPFPELVGYAASDGAMCTLRLLARLQPLLPKPHAAFGGRVKKPVAESLAALEQIHAWLAQMRHSDPGYSWKNQALADWMASGPVFDAMQLMDSREWLPVAQAFYERAGAPLH